MLTTLRVAVLCSQRAPGIGYLIEASRRDHASFEPVCCVSSDAACVDADRVASSGVPFVTHARRAFYETYAPGRRLGDHDARIAYDQQTVRVLAEYQPDLVILAGYLLLLTSPMLTAYAGRIVNVHHSDLLLRNATGGPRYPGLRAVRDAVLAGEPETRSSVHFVTERLDDGPMIARSAPYPVAAAARWALQAGERDVVRSVIWAHQEWMLRDAFGPLMVRAIEHVATMNAAVRECA